MSFICESLWAYEMNCMSLHDVNTVKMVILSSHSFKENEITLQHDKIRKINSGNHQ